jgi:hypothetical protein
VRDIIGRQRVFLKVPLTAVAHPVALRVAMLDPELLAVAQLPQEGAAMFGMELL